MLTVAPPEEIDGLSVSPSDPVFFWVNGSERRIVVAEWGQLKVLGQRVFRRFRGGKVHWSNLQATLHRLEVPGRPAAAVFGRNVVGYVRPWSLDDQKASREGEPAMIARRSRGRGFYLISPVLLPSVEHGRELLRRLLREHGAVPSEWRCYEGEAPDEPMDKLFAGSNGVRTELEHRLTQSFGPAGRARQAFTPADVLMAG